MKPTSVGQLMVNEALPEALRLKGTTLDKTTVVDLLRKVAEGHPEKYKDILRSLNDIGRDAAYTAGVSVSLSGLQKSAKEKAIIAKVRRRAAAIQYDDTLDAKAKQEALVQTVLPMVDEIQAALKSEAEKEGNPYWFQVKSGARGKISDFNSIRGATGLVEDHRDNPVPIPILHSYGEGLDPVEYWAGTYGQRKGMIGTKMATADAGFAAKRLVNAAHRIVVTHDAPEPTRLPVGLPVKVSDKDNIGAVLAADAGGHKAGTLITPEVHADLEDAGVEDVLVHSPMTEHNEDGGVSQLAAGRRDRGRPALRGENLGIPAAQSIGEKLSQGQLNSKHVGGMSGGSKVTREGIEYLNRLIEAPESFPEAGPLSEIDGVITEIKGAPQGGQYVHVGDQQYYLAAGLNPVVAKGDHVEEGDDLSDGIPHPEQLVRLRGVGEARRVYSDILYEGLKNSGVQVNRRNVETVTAGLLNWGKVTDAEGHGEHIVDDVAPWGSLVKHYKPRADAKLVPVGSAHGRYLEEPVLHYTPGTRVTKRVKKDLEKWGIKDLHVHEAPPPFQPFMQRGMLGVHSDPDWQTRLAGFYTTSAFTEAVHRGRTSDSNSTSFVPGLVAGHRFGEGLGATGKYGPAQPPSPPPVPRYSPGAA